MVSLEPYGTLRIPFLCAILRIADETENYWTRALQKYLLSKIRQTGISLYKSVRRYIENVEFCLVGECIILHVPTLDLDIGQNDPAGHTQNHEFLANRIQTRKEVAEKLTKIRADIHSALTNWSEILCEENIRYLHVFFEHQNMLFDNLSLDDENELSKQGLAILLNENANNGATVKDLLDAIVRLSLGSLGHSVFNWQSLEAKLGCPLFEREKWILQRLNHVSPFLEVRIGLDNKIKLVVVRDKIQEIYKNVGLDYE